MGARKRARAVCGEEGWPAGAGGARRRTGSTVQVSGAARTGFPPATGSWSLRGCALRLWGCRDPPAGGRSTCRQETHTTPHRPSGQNKAQRRPGGMCGAQTCEAAFGVTMKGFATVNDYGSRCRKTRRRQLQSSDSIGCLRHHALLLLAALTGGRGMVLTGWFRCSCKADLQLQSPVAGPDRSGLATVGLATVLLQRSR